MSLEPQNKDILENVDWYFVPVLNPDGYEYTHTEDRLWRKSRSLSNGADCVGVDLNRSNFCGSESSILPN
jgi:murein tripeptide amidase MpaA